MVYAAIRNSKSLQKDFRLSGQLTGAAISVMGNIPEGFVRRSNREFIQFLFISLSSAAELQSHMYVAIDQEYVTELVFHSIYQQAEKTAMLISGLITYLRNYEDKPGKRNRRDQPIQRYQPNRPNKPDKLNQPDQQRN
jgi:four helix bundle protein